LFVTFSLRFVTVTGITARISGLIACTACPLEIVMPAIPAVVNGASVLIDPVDPQTPLLWALRETLRLTGTKYGCGIGLCGACTVLIDGTATRSCVIPVAAVANKSVTTIEGLSRDSSHPVQRAWLAEQVAQCGYCQSGQMISAAALIARNPNPSDSDIDAAMAGNLCRCGTYQRIRRAIHRAAQLSKEDASVSRRP
jgi:aerobic-type carbon monoxide dehydrogenase small subunit (CoxS/CutS family)